jgi:hypothetical protein
MFASGFPSQPNAHFADGILETGSFFTNVVLASCITFIIWLQFHLVVQLLLFACM